MRESHFVQSLERGLAVIRAFDAEHPELTPSDVARAHGLTRAAARRFPVIRFDAAMVLARKHVRRLWFPGPGEGGGGAQTGDGCGPSGWGGAGRCTVCLRAREGGSSGPPDTAYYAGRRKVGMRVVYADAASHIHYFKLQWWRTTPPSGDVGWAYASQSVSSLTLQTCVGADSSLRLVVRFVEVARP